MQVTLMSYRYSFLVSSPGPKGHSELFLIILRLVNAAGILLIPFSSCLVTPQNTTKYHKTYFQNLTTLHGYIVYLLIYAMYILLDILIHYGKIPK